ncbi:MAG: M13 family metallopeptidase [Polyangia bacterium]
MNRRLVAALALSLLPATAFAADAPLTELPYTPSLDTAAMDRAVDPCTDFYAYTCGGWQQHHPIPPDQSSWSVYGKLGEDITKHVWGLLEVASQPKADRDPISRRVGDAFAACMDVKAIDARGATPLDPALASLKGVADTKQLLGWVAARDREFGSVGFFGYTSEQDASDATHYILAVTEGGLGLPDRDYYLKKDARSVDMRKKYVTHVQNMLGLLGDDAAEQRKASADVMRIETALAKAWLTRVEHRDPHKVFHKLPYAELHKLAPNIDWDAFFADVGVKAPAMVDIQVLAFVKEVGALLKREPIAALKHYVRWHLVADAASELSKPFVDESFAFNGHILRGVEQLPPRWKTCSHEVTGALPEDVGQLFVRKNFGPATKTRALVMVKAIEAEMEKDLTSLEWMSGPTRAQALTKLHTMANKIGFPDHPRDYSSIVIKRDDFFGNVLAANRFETKRDAAKVGNVVDRGEWFMSASDVNAYYSSQMNDINFPAGVLQPPLFDPKLDDAPNYGNTGATIGHELTHGFDDEGRQFDSLGNLRDWWTPADDAEFRRRAKCVSDQYSTYTIVDDIKINGKLTLGEDVADLGGLILAYRAWKTTTPPAAMKSADGLTAEQRFFVGYAQWACANERPEALRVSAITNPHSPPKARVNGLVVNVPEFGKAFQCKPGAAMVKPADKVCKVW